MRTVVVKDPTATLVLVLHVLTSQLWWGVSRRSRQFDMTAVLGSAYKHDKACACLIRKQHSKSACSAMARVLGPHGTPVDRLNGLMLGKVYGRIAAIS